MKVLSAVICVLFFLNIFSTTYAEKNSKEEINELEKLAAKARQKKTTEKTPLQSVYKMYISLAQFGHSMPKLRAQAKKSLHLSNSEEQSLYDELHPELSTYA